MPGAVPGKPLATSRTAAGHRREHERPDHADHQDRGSQCLETLGNVIHQPGERLSRRLGSNRSEDHVPLPRIPSPLVAQRAVKQSLTRRALRCTYRLRRCWLRQERITGRTRLGQRPAH